MAVGNGTTFQRGVCLSLIPGVKKSAPVSFSLSFFLFLSLCIILLPSARITGRYTPHLQETVSVNI